MVTPTTTVVWPDNLVDAAAVRAWIADVVADGDDRPPVTGPERIYRQKDWGVTARFAVAQVSTPTVIFKACDLPIFASPAAVHEVLVDVFPEQTPTLLAATAVRAQTWSLFREFAGKPLADEPKPTALTDLARTIAAIQAGIAARPAALERLPRTPVARLTRIFDVILDDIRDGHLARWYSPEQRDAARFGLPDDPLDVLLAHRAHVADWARELSEGGWPVSLDHVDLRTANAQRLADGRLLVYDWEEATVSCPFFSLDRLLDQARMLDRPDLEDGQGPSDAFAAAANVTVNGTALCGGAHEIAVRRAYLERLPWRSAAERERGLDLALCLAPIKFAQECKVFTHALAWDRQWSTLTAFCVARALQRWGSFLNKYGE